MAGRILRPHKAIVAPSFGSRSVLTREPWAFVRLWLKREKSDKALFYWEQAKTFYDASRGLPLESAPLLLYYAFMNAVKALLAAKDVPFSPYHGVKEWKASPTARDCLRRVGVEVRADGVLPALAGYLGDAASGKRHTLRDLFFNMPFIHRTYCLTYRGQTDMFIPIKECMFVRDNSTGRAYFSAQLSLDHQAKRVLKQLPPSFIADTAAGKGFIRSHMDVPLTGVRVPSKSDLFALGTLNRQLRADLFYINGAQTLWYVKLNAAGATRLARHGPTLVLAAMHRLSELCRYHPMDFVSYLGGKANWLLHEFIEMSSVQFVDEIAAELTGHQFLVPNVRPAD